MEKKYPRVLKLSELLEKKSHFLFGPRSTGKSTLIHTQLKPKSSEIFDLLERDTYRRLLQDPEILGRVDQKKVIVIDEIQKLPHLLDEVHRLIHRNGTTFLLTGSSSRKLKRGSANLLAGRAWQARLFPLVSCEIPNFNLETYLTRGGLPHVTGSEHWERELSEYVSLYLREEIAGEALVRNVEAYAEFLDLIARSNGQEINYQNFSSDFALSVNTIKNYFDIVEETLLGFRLPAYTKTVKRKAISRAKHFLFDPGVVNILCEQGPVKKKSPAFGMLFEHFIIMEVRAALSYFSRREKMTYWRSTNKQEVDLIIGNKLAVEIKGTDTIQRRHLRGLKALREEKQIKGYMAVSLDPLQQISEEGIECLFWKEFLDRLWSNTLF